MIELINIFILYFLLIGMILLWILLFGVCREIVNVILILFCKVLSVGIIFEVESVIWCFDKLYVKLFNIIFIVGIMLFMFNNGLFIFIIIMLVIGCMFVILKLLMIFEVCYICLIIFVMFKLWLKFCWVVE